MSGFLLECCVDSVQSARCAVHGGADRLELCANLIIGGTTPTLSLYEQIRTFTDIPIHILFRPRFGDFLYTEDELKILEGDIRLFRKAGAQGAVIGCLTPDGRLDLTAIDRLVAAARGGNERGMSVTLHRAFDMCSDPLQALSEARSLGVNTILTSGQAASAAEGIPLLNRLLQEADGEITILAGAGINAASVPVLLDRTSLSAYHMSGKLVLPSGMRYRNPRVSMGLPGISEYEIWQTDPEEIRAVRRLLDEKAASLNP